MSKKLNVAFAFALVTSSFLGTSAHAQQYPFAPNYTQSGPSPLVSEDQLMSLGCGMISRDVRSGTMTYECPADVAGNIQPSQEGDGVRCHYQGTAISRQYRLAVTRFQCNENATDYDYSPRSQPRAGQDYDVVPDGYGGGVVIPPERYIPYDQQDNGNNGRQRHNKKYNP